MAPRKGSIPWNKDLTKETDERVKKNGESNSKTIQKKIENNEYMTWNKGLKKGDHPSLVHSEESYKRQAKSHSKWHTDNKDTEEYKLIGEKISKANKGRILSKEVVEKLSKDKKGKTYEEIYGIEIAQLKKNNMSKSMTGKNKGRKLNKTSKDVKKKLRIAMLKNIEKNYGIGYPAYNKKACEVFKKFDEINNTSGRYAMYGNGEYKDLNLGYIYDYINFDLKLIIEVDEKHHFTKSGKLKEKDIQRQKEIQEFYPDFKFLRFKDSEIDNILNIGEKNGFDEPFR